MWTGGDAGRVVLLNKRFGAYRSVETSKRNGPLINDAYWLDNASCVTRSFCPKKAEALLEKCSEYLTSEEKEFLTRLMRSVEPVLAKDELQETWDNTSFAQLVKDICQCDEVSYEQLSEKSGIPLSVLCGVFAGVLKPNMKHAHKIADALGYSRKAFEEKV
jgi:hypothetical protein